MHDKDRKELDDLFNHPEVKKFLEEAERDMLPMMKKSVLALTILGNPDGKLCMEMGAAILYDKPIIVMVPPNAPVNSNIRRVASAIVEMDMDNIKESQRKLEIAVKSVMANDIRIKK